MTKCLTEYFTDKEPLLALVKTGILMVVMTFIVTLLGSLLGGFQGMIIAVLFAGTMNIFAWYKSDSLVLRIYKAKLAPKQSELSKIGLLNVNSINNSKFEFLVNEFEKDKNLFLTVFSQTSRFKDGDNSPTSANGDLQCPSIFSQTLENGG